MAASPEARLSADRQRPAEDPHRARPSARPLRRGRRSRHSRRSTARAATTPSPRATPWACSAAADRLVLVEGVDGRRNADGRLTGGWKAADVEGGRRVPRASAARHGARARRRGGRRRTRRSRRRCARRRATCCVYEVRATDLAAVGRRAVRASAASRSNATRAGCSSSSSARTSTSSRRRSTSSPPGRRASRSASAEVEELVAAHGRRADLRAHRCVGPRATSAARSRRASRSSSAPATPTRRRVRVRPPRGHVERVRAVQRARRGGHVRPRDATRAEAAPVRRREGVRAGRNYAEDELRAATRPPRRARPSRSRAAAGWRPSSSSSERWSTSTRWSERSRQLLAAAGFLAFEPTPQTCRRRAARPAPSCGAAVFRWSAPLRGRLVDPAHELEVLGGDRLRVAVGDRGLEPLRQRLHRRAVAEVLELARSAAMRTRFFCCWMFGIAWKCPHLRAGDGSRGRRRRGAAPYARAPWTQRAHAPPARLGRRRSSRSRPGSRAFSGSSARSSPPTTSASRGQINAFTVAFQIPNLMRALVADAALSSAFVPGLQRAAREGRPQARLAGRLEHLLAHAARARRRSPRSSSSSRRSSSGRSATRAATSSSPSGSRASSSRSWSLLGALGSRRRDPEQLRASSRSRR